jgi:hypothetical protein
MQAGVFGFFALVGVPIGMLMRYGSRWDVIGLSRSQSRRHQVEGIEALDVTVLYRETSGL